MSQAIGASAAASSPKGGTLALGGGVVGALDAAPSGAEVAVASGCKAVGGSCATVGVSCVVAGSSWLLAGLSDCPLDDPPPSEVGAYCPELEVEARP